MLIALTPGASAQIPMFGKGDKQKRAAEYAQMIHSGSYALAAKAAEDQFTRRAKRREKKGEVDPRSLLVYVQAGSALLWAGELEQSIARFDQSEIVIKEYETRMLGAGGLEAAGATLLGNRVKRYRPKASDGVLVNTYKALAFMAQGRLDDARVELHRADERTRRAVEMFAKELEKERGQSEQAGAESRPHSEQVSSIIGEHYPGIEQWDVYDDFVNPFSVYLHALYFFSAQQGASDIEHAVTSIKRVAGMHPGNKVLEEDLLLMDQVASGRLSRNQIPDSVWVICADGLAPTVDAKEVQVVLPVNQQPVPLMLVLPELRLNADSAGGCNVDTGDQQYSAEQIASMDRVIKSEFRKRLPREIAQSVSSMLVRGAVQNEMQKQAGALGALAGIVYQRNTASTETRVWQGLPKAWYAVRVPRPADGQLTVVGADGRTLVQTSIPPARLSLLVVRNPTPRASPAANFAVLAAH